MLCKHKLLFWMRLIAINRCPVLILIKYTTNPLTYLLTYHLRLTDINIIINFLFFLEYLFIAQMHTSYKKCFNITTSNDSMISV